MEPTCVHHVEFGVHDGLKQVQKFLSQYHFRIVGTRATPYSKQWLVGSHDIRFLITELSGDNVAIENDPFVHCWNSPTENTSLSTRDSAFNVALRVKNIEGCVNRLLKQNVQIVKPLQTLSDDTGTVRVCMAKSCMGNVVHTLIDDSNYTGLFLPGFQAFQDNDDSFTDTKDTRLGPSTVDLRYIDHVTCCVPCGSSASVVKWYEKCFGMKRFFINRDDDEDEGFVLDRKDIGLRLTSFKYWKCAEIGLATEENAMGSVKFVLGEALPNQGPNSVDMFLKNHGEPGVQHVALHTGDILGTISQLHRNGVKFSEPPYTYYTEVGKLKEILVLGLDVDQIKKNGILVDKEQDDDGQTGKNGTEENGSSHPDSVKYLMQKFTRPLFDADTFFLEVIQRMGAIGFGSGNIIALWKSMQVYIEETEAGGIPSDQA